MGDASMSKTRGELEVEIKNTREVIRLTKVALGNAEDPERRTILNARLAEEQSKLAQLRIARDSAR